MIKSAYIHIPFCKKFCSYCDFCKLFYQKKFVREYLKYLKEEIKGIYQNDILDTIYIGGGTPSCLSIEELESLFEIISIFHTSKKLEFSIECNFDSITKEKLLLFKKYGVNRLSFGLESVHPKNLEVLERVESRKKVISTIKLCRKLGFSNINIDLMYAIPGENLSMLEEDLNFILSLEVEHISTYSLMIEEHTKLFLADTSYISEDLDFSMYQLICSKLREKYVHYEISNFAKEGYFSQHNLCYWYNLEYYGFGLGASSYIGNKRFVNTRSITKYLKKEVIMDYENLSKNDKMNYEMILGLRLCTGVSKSDFFHKYHVSIEEVYPIEELILKKLLLDNNGSIRIPEDKLYLSNEVFIHFIKE